MLRYGQSRVILHAGALVPVPAARFTVHGSRGSFIKYGLDPQEDVLKTGKRPPAADWGYEPVPATLTVRKDCVAETRELACIPGNYPAYYAGVRDAIRGIGPIPVTVAEAICVIALLEIGLQSAREGRSLLLRHDEE